RFDCQRRSILAMLSFSSMSPVLSVAVRYAETATSLCRAVAEILEHHRAIHVIAKPATSLKFSPCQQLPYEIRLPLCSLPHAKIFESVDAHAIRREHERCQRTKD